MGYFPNGTSGEQYQRKYCDNCLHDEKGDCRVWLAHLITEYSDKNGETSEAGKVLDLLIPNDNNIGCNQCTMFIDKNRDRRKNTRGQP